MDIAGTHPTSAAQPNSSIQLFGPGPLAVTVPRSVAAVTAYDEDGDGLINLRTETTRGWALTRSIGELARSADALGDGNGLVDAQEIQKVMDLFDNGDDAAATAGDGILEGREYERFRARFAESESYQAPMPQLAYGGPGVFREQLTADEVIAEKVVDKYLGAESTSRSDGEIARGLEHLRSERQAQLDWMRMLDSVSISPSSSHRAKLDRLAAEIGDLTRAFTYFDSRDMSYVLAEGLKVHEAAHHARGGTTAVRP